MEKQEKISKFIRPIKPGEIFDSSEQEPESVENTLLRADKKQPLLITFLNKFTQADLEAMEKYIDANKYLLEMAVKQKISLFEDIIIIVEFRKELAVLRNERDRVRTIEAISDRLQPVIKRSKMTIKERVTKKLAHCSVQEVMAAMRNKKDLTFSTKNDKTKTITHQPSSNSIEDLSNPQNKKESSHDQLEISEIKREPSANSMTVAPNTNQARKIIDSAFKSLSGNRIYRYGTKNVQERIFVYANSNTKEILYFNKTNFNELKTKYQIQLPNFPNKAQVQKPVEESKEMEGAVPGEQSNIDQNTNNMSEEQLEAYIQSIKKKTCQMLSESSSNETNETHKQLSKYLEAIQQLQAKLYAPKHSEEDMSGEPPEINNKEHSTKQAQNSTGKKTTQQERQTPRKDIDEAAEKRKLLYKLSDNLQYLQQVEQEPHRLQEFAWEEDEDNILYSFKFNPEAYKTEMGCLLRYKTAEAVHKRMKFLTLETNLSLIDLINKLGNKSVEFFNPPASELMEIE